MSPENVEIARRWCTVMTEGGEATQAAIAEFADADIDYYPVRRFPEAQPCHGLEAFRRFLDRFLDSYSQTEWVIRRVVEVGDDRVLVCATMRAEGRGSGLALEGDVYNCFWFRHGRFFRVEDHVTLKGALHALGLDGEALEAVGLAE